jgi:hypothetical protein
MATRMRNLDVNRTMWCILLLPLTRKISKAEINIKGPFRTKLGAQEHKREYHYDDSEAIVLPLELCEGTIDDTYVDDHGVTRYYDRIKDTDE